MRRSQRLTSVALAPVLVRDAEQAARLQEQRAKPVAGEPIRCDYRFDLIDPPETAAEKYGSSTPELASGSGEAPTSPETTSTRLSDRHAPTSSAPASNPIESETQMHAC